MGLDMYLNRMPRYGKATATDVANIENYIDYINAVGNPDSSARNYSMEEWCGVSKSDIDVKMLDFYQHFYNKKYSTWDTEHEYGYDRIMEQVAYWRKANHIHKWFVKNVQDGEDDCSYHDEVTKEVLIELLMTCMTVLASSELDEDGELIKNPKVAMELLPTTSGFFFGGTDYDEWYYRDVEYTAETIKKILETTDFEIEMIYYVSSW